MKQYWVLDSNGEYWGWNGSNNGSWGVEKERQAIFRIEGLWHNAALEITPWTVQILHQYLDPNIKKSPWGQIQMKNHISWSDAAPMLRLEFPSFHEVRLTQESLLVLSQWQEHLKFHHFLCFCSLLSPVPWGPVSGSSFLRTRERRWCSKQPVSKGFPKPSTLIFGTSSCSWWLCLRSLLQQCQDVLPAL